MSPWCLTILVLAASPSLLLAQGGGRPPTGPPRPVARDTGALVPRRDMLPNGARPDSTTSDSAAAPQQLVQWAQPDSVMAALLAKQGYTITRYQGATVVFDANGRTLKVDGEGAVQHEQTLLVADSIRYNDAAKRVRAMSVPGDSVILRDPDQGTSDIRADSLTYDIGTKHGTGTNIRTSSAQGGQQWYVTGGHVGFTADSTTNGHPVSYGMGASITSDSMPEPDYHFQVKEFKMISKSLMVARPAVLYIQDIPVFWLPFVFQDMRSGRHSGILPPRFGLSDIIRTGSGYRRTIENVGYYFALNDYMDAQFSLDWRSSNGAETNQFGVSDPGWLRYNAQWHYRWLNRFLSGGVQASYTDLSDGSTDFALSWQHSQQFSQRSQLSASVNYESNTTVRQQQAFNVAQALATIYSSLNFQQQLGPLSLSIGGNRRQFSGRSEVDETLPTLTVTSKPINLASWLVWSPNLSVSNTEQLHLDQLGSQFGFRYQRNALGALDSTKVEQNTRTTTLSFDTPLRIGNFQWQNSFRVSDNLVNFPQLFHLQNVRDTSIHIDRVYAQSYLTTVDWTTGINLPSISQGKWNLTPSVQIVNVDPGGYWVRSQLTGGKFVHQQKRLQYGLSISPTFFGLFPGFGPFSRIRHSITPSLSFTYSPAASVSDEYLAALGKTRATYLGALAQEQLTLHLNQTIEAKVRGASDTAQGGAKKIKLLSIDVSPLTYDFERARATHGSGFATSNFSYSLRSDLLPGFDLTVGYSLFQGDPLSDTAQFKPFRQTISAQFSIGRNQNPFATLTRLFGGAVTPDSLTATEPLGASNPLMQQPNIAGGAASQTPIGVTPNAGWQATFNFSSSRQRPIVGGEQVVVDPEQLCRAQYVDPILIDRCIQQQQGQEQQNAGIPTTVGGAPIIRFPARSTLRANLTFNLTPRWAMQWGTGYDFEANKFSDHYVTLQREFRSWRATFAFTSAPNGNFAFNFFIALKAEPDLKFNYDRRTYRP
ncbi:MAG TPA: putative LPS assembly protein LptD [Gemmatimonadaceae bacterium]|nr:putative LPS assembly protein LptD [Gemmatimonadaceae bacterium]